MEFCDWIQAGFKCFRCEHFCARDCPFEGDDAVEKLRLWLRRAGDATQREGKPIFEEA